MEVLVLDGKNYVKASKAARELGYATDYVGQLCRSGQVDSHLIGRTWYVNQDELSTHRVEKKRNSRVKAREYAKKTIEEYRKQNEKGTDTIAIRYEQDTETLIPETRKISIISEKPRFTRVVHEEDTPQKTVIENKGKKVLMSGNLSVVDVTDGEIDEDTTVLTSRIVPVSKEKKAPRIDDLPHEVPEEDVVEPQKRISFRERLSVEDANTSKVAIQEEEVAPEATTIPSITADALIAANTPPSLMAYITAVCLLVTVLVATLGISKISSYSYGESGVEVTSSLTFQFSKILRK